MGEGSSNSSKQHANFLDEFQTEVSMGIGMLTSVWNLPFAKMATISQFTKKKVNVKKLMANTALTAHIFSQTMRDESTLTYADNGI